MKLAKVLELVGAFFAKWAAEEAKAWGIWVTRRFFERTLRIAPEPLLSKYNNEWLGRIDSLPGTVVASARLMIAALHISSWVLWAKSIARIEYFRLYVLFCVGLLTCWVSLKGHSLVGGDSRSLVANTENSKLTVYLLLLIAVVVVLNKSASLGNSETAPA